MDTEQWASLKLVFEELLDLDAQARHTRLATLAATDPELCAQLARLLDADASAERRLQRIEAPLSPARAGARSEVPVAESEPGAEAPRDPFGLAGCTVSHFEVQELLSAGGMGVVYRAADLRLGRPVAMKFLLPQYSLDPAAKERFLLEARTAAALDHPHICTIYEAGESPQGQLFLAMRCYEGQTLHARLQREEALPVEEALELTRQILRGLDAAHAAGIVHRDLKPGNLMLTTEGAIKILDFGIAKVRDLSLTGSGQRPGTAAYMSPEQIDGRTVDARSDLWSVGVVLYEMLTGRQPFGAGHELSTLYRILNEEPAAPSSLRPEVPAGLEQVVLRLLRKEPAERYGSAAEVLEHLSGSERSLLPGPHAQPPRGPADARLVHLPSQPTALVGREREIADAATLLSASRLLTLTGPGGTGKTRLALQLATERQERFPDGVFFVNLAPVTDPERVPSAIAQALGIRESPLRPTGETLPELLRGKRMLLLLDNFEHLAAAAPFVARLLSCAAEPKVLVTSRELLHLQGEQQFAVPPLTLPERDRPASLERLGESEAVQLFVVRAKAVKPDFQLTEENAAAVAAICHRLDGLPLALELAAARIRVLPPQAMLSRLQSRLKLLTGGARNLPERQQTLRGTIGWSHELLSDAEKVLFRRLSVFAGGRTLDAIEAVCGGEGDLELDVLEGTASLVDKSLLKLDDAGVEPRFVMLETIHEYAAERLQESGEADRVRERHAQFFLALAEAAEPQLHGREPAQWLARLEQEHDNFRTALSWLLATEDGAVSALRLSSALWYFWYACGHIPEGSAWMERALARSEGIEDTARTRTLNFASRAAYYRGDLERSDLLAQAALASASRGSDLVARVTALSTLQLIASDRGEHERAREFAEQAIPPARATGDPRLLSNLLNNLGVSAYRRGDYRRARELYEEAVARSEEAGNEAALDCNLNNLGGAALAEGDVPAAATYYRRALEISIRLGKQGFIAAGVEGLAAIHSARGASVRAARLYGAAAALREAVRFPREPTGKPQYDRLVAKVRQALGEDGLAAHWAEGQAMTLEQAVAYALEREG